ncbi:hypothetical protein J7T55_008958 [Diaporthe amygdali]|uniref:uncharacterized protein n=1 Tax=Phomopsis amygdali TaxID=1214568 RepID=UPI0022FE6A27|nr:uncharacterized protein J7T55_008958 [Diaporthe amygdali]KAJ0121791.1 hypothetical protein J7T55_008958 [Diaporthe amygdali]
MDSAALDPRLRNPPDSSSISVSVAPAAAASSSSASSPSPSNSTSGPNGTPTANRPSSGSGTRNANGPGPAGPLHTATSAHTPGSVSSSPELQRMSDGVPFQSAYPHPNANAHTQAHAQAHAHAHPVTASSSTGAFSDEPPGDQDNSGADPKKARACEACRGLKVRCEPAPDDPEGACKRCAKAGRNCIITQPTRKRQKKTDSRVAELEKKIDALTATLSATKAGQAGQVGNPLFTHPGATTGFYGSPGIDPSRSWSAVDAGTSSREANMARAQDPSLVTEGIARSSASPLPSAGQKRKYTEPTEIRSNPSMPSRSQGFSDLIDRGIITMSKAAQLLDRYNYEMTPHLPGVVLPPSLTAGELRETKPILFLAIMAAASSETPEIQRIAVKELMQTFAERIVIIGEKSLELVQALTVAVMWYWPPEDLEDIKFYQLVHMAMIMALDLGLGKRKPRGSKPSLWGSPTKRHPQPDPTTIEARRTWLLCYYLTVNTAMALHRPFLLRWTTFMAECMDILESSPEAAPTDKYFCHLVWTHQLVEEIGFQFCMDDPSVSVSLSDHMTQHRIRSFERELDKHKTQVPAELMQPSLKLGFDTLSLYMHELALQTDPADAFKAPFPSDSLVSNAPLTPAYTSALAACLTAIDGIFDTFLVMDPVSIRCMPVFNFVRISYATVILIKIYLASSDPSSDLGKVIDKDSLKVEQRLSHLIEKYRAVAANGKYRPASNFLTIIVMIRSWFLKFSQGDLKRDAAKADIATRATAPSQAENSTQARSNPLQLLSEAATNNQAAGGNSQTQSATNVLAPSNNGNTDVNTAWANSSHGASSNQKPDGGRNSSMPPPPQPQTPVHAHQHGFMGGSPAPWLSFGSDFDYISLGDGFAQAWDMTMEGLGDGQGGLQDFNNGFALLPLEPLSGPTGGNVPGSDVFPS